MYSCTLSLTLTLDGNGWSIPRPGRFTPGKETRYPLYSRLGGPQGRSGYRGYFLGLRWPGREVDNSFQSSVEVKNEGICIFILSICLHDVIREHSNIELAVSVVTNKLCTN
jgi:hypothetical protein